MIDIFKACVENVRKLKKERKQLKILFNNSLLSNRTQQEELLTKLYALLYSSFAEVCFLQTIHTPNGFSEDEIRQISRERNLENQWKKCLTLALSRIENNTNKGEIANKRQILFRLLNKYILEPSQLRNKIAHGQWAVALNSENSATNSNTTNKVKSLDFVQVDVLFEIYLKFGQVIEDLIESPHKTHFRDFYYHLDELKALVEKTKEWTIASKKAILKNKKAEQLKKTN